MTIYRGYLLTPLRGGGWADVPDGTLEVRDGVIIAVGRGRRHDFDLRPNLLILGFVDIHAHVPQLSVYEIHPDDLLQ